MAIWQFNIEFFPSEGIEAELGHLPNKLPSQFLPDAIDINTDLDEYEDPRIKFWMNQSRAEFTELITKLTSELQEVEWLKNSTDVFSWGNEDTNDLTLSFTEVDKIESFGCRIDLREIDEEFIDLILDLCTSRDYLLTDRKGNIRTPERLELGKLIANSNPANFVADPEQFLKNFEQGKQKPE